MGSFLCVSRLLTALNVPRWAVGGRACCVPTGLGAWLCVRCPPDDGRDPVDAVVETVAAVDPSLSSDVVAAAVTEVVPRAGQRYQIAWALQDRPGLLTGDGAQAPVPAILRLIDRLCEAGAGAVVRPPCPHCGRVIPLVKPWNGARLCRNCVAKSRAESCSRCGSVREAATRDEHGRPLCPNCLITDVANQEICTSCDRQRPVSVRTPEGPLCPNCRPWKTATCGICGREAPCAISQTTSEPWCTACKQRRARCAGCGWVDRVRGGTKTEPLCATCTRPDPDFWTSCPTCGETGRIHPHLAALYRALPSAERPGTVAAWLDKFFKARNAIVHDLDYEDPAASNSQARWRRKMEEVRDDCDAVLTVVATTIRATTTNVRTCR